LTIYRATRGFAKAVLSLVIRFDVEGLGNIPPDGGVIICGNHFHWLDPVTVGITMQRDVSFMAKQELFESRLGGWFLRKIKAFPVKRGQPDRAALKRSIEVLQEGGCFGIFPEGTRSRTRTLQKAEPGTAYLAMKSGAPVVPVGITGSYKLFSRVIVRYGKPIDMAQFQTGKLSSESLEAVSEAVMTGIGALLVPPVRPEVAAAQDEVPPGSDH
jgi:1-acyl-sn-glycerol-3-phosphate acyltransferase